MQTMSFLGIIPARYASTRFPGKPLVNIGGKLMIQRVYERASAVVEEVVVATDDLRIVKAVEGFGGKVVLTGVAHRSGTDRCAEALNEWEHISKKKFTGVINIQGDEPFIHTGQIEGLKQCFTDSTVQIATLIKEIDDKNVLFDSNRPKVVVDHKNMALYFSRSPVPFVRDAEPEFWLQSHVFYQHIGLYAYRTKILNEIACLKPGILESAESLEQLRWLEHGYQIKTAVTEYDTFGIDTPEDLEKAIKAGLMNR